MKVIDQKLKYYIWKHFSTFSVKSLDVHFALSGSHRLQIEDNGMNGSETTVSVVYSKWC